MLFPVAPRVFSRQPDNRHRTADNHVRVIHLLSTANPQAGVARFEFTPESGKAAVSSRMRLAKTQDIVALAETSNGEFWVARTKVTVTIGGCGG